MKTEPLFTADDLISSYTRAEAIADGVLIEVPARIADEARIKYPVAVTIGAWSEAVALPEGYKGMQDETGRLWDVLTGYVHRVLNTPKPGNQIEFEISVRQPNGKNKTTVKLKAMCHPGDNMEPVVTIMLPDED